MRWQLEAAIKQGLSRMPRGPLVYRWLQRRGGRLAHLDVDEYWPERGRVLQLAGEHGVAIAGARILEIGTGWHPVLALVASVRGANRVTTIDINPWMDRETLRAAAVAALRIVADEQDLVPDRVARVQALARHDSPETPVRDALAAIEVDYQSPADATSTALPDGSIDLVVHSDVFEHVPPAVIARMLCESRRVLRPGGLHVARICPGDHFAENDPGITSAHHLRYSERSWRWIGGSGLAYHNRLRAADHARAFGQAGFTVVQLSRRIDERARTALRDGVERPHPSFALYDADELSTTSLHLVARA